jgi:CrcB protein
MQNPRLHAKSDGHPDLPLDPDESGELSRTPHLSITLQTTVFVGGCLGTATRYGVTSAGPVSTIGWQTGTFTVNLIGAFVLGWLLQTLSHGGKDVGMPRVLRLGIGTGFIGGFTTYSSLAVETVLLMRAGHAMLAVIYIATSVVCGIFACVLGIWFASHYHRRTRRRG